MIVCFINTYNSTFSLIYLTLLLDDAQSQWKQKPHVNSASDGYFPRRLRAKGCGRVAGGDPETISPPQISYRAAHYKQHCWDINRAGLQVKSCQPNVILGFFLFFLLFNICYKLDISVYFGSPLLLSFDYETQFVQPQILGTWEGVLLNVFWWKQNTKEL